MKDSETGITTTYYYDLTGRMMKYTESGAGYSHSVGYAYDAQNNLTRLEETVNGAGHTTAYTYDEENRILSSTTDGITVEYDYDDLGRVTTQTTKNGSTVILTESYTYKSPTSTTTSAQIATYTTAVPNGYSVTYSYTYDANGNITSISDGTNTTGYVYDSANQLIRENNQAGGFTYKWTYDDAGNILLREEYAYTTGTLGTPTETVNYTYGNSDWGDLLTAYGGALRSYDQIGNLLSDGTWSYTWKHGRQLVSMTNTSGLTWTFQYNADGMRTARTGSNGVSYTYVYNGGQLTRMTSGSYVLDFAYDANGTPLTVTWNGAAYYYVTNLQGDVVAILNASGSPVVQYAYDAWGKILSTTGTIATTLGTYNPLRYRSYVYDTETGLYYVSSRYYDPEIGRWINADSQLNTSLGMLGLNQFSYCLNNPVNSVDYSGSKPGDLFDTMDDAARDFAEYINAKSISDNREYASYIYTRTVIETRTITYVNPSVLSNNPLMWLWNIIFRGSFTRTVTTKVKVTKYTYREPKRGTADSVTIPINWFGLHTVVGHLHTHAAYDPAYMNDIFSENDKRNAKRQGVLSYVATPLGIMRKYDPKTGTDIILYDDLPFDPNHPGR